MLGRGLLTGCWVVLVVVSGCGATPVDDPDLPQGGDPPVLGASGAAATEPAEGGAAAGGWADASCSQRLYSVSSLDPAGENVTKLRDLGQTEAGAPTLLSFTRYSGRTYSALNGCSADTANTTGLFQVDRVMPLPTAELVELSAHW